MLIGSRSLREHITHSITWTVQLNIQVGLPHLRQSGRQQSGGDSEASGKEERNLRRVPA